MSRASEPKRGSASTRHGLTLIELVLVMGVLGLVAGIGLGMFATFDPGRRAAVGLVQNVLRAAHNTAVARTAPAAVRIDTGAGTLRAEGLEVVGTWRFESAALTGARGLDMEPIGFPGEFLTDDGHRGRALDLLLGPRGSKVVCDVLDDPIFDPAGGFQIDFALRPYEASETRVLDLGGAVTVDARRDGAVEARFVARRVDEFGRPTAGARIAVRSRGAVLRPGRWTRLSIVYDRRALRVFADGVQVAVRPETRPVWRIEGRLELGGGREPWPGALDDLVISVVAGAEEVALPASVRFAPGTPELVRFAPGGALDPLEHSGPVELQLVFEDESVARIRVNPYGTVE